MNSMKIFAMMASVVMMSSMVLADDGVLTPKLVTMTPTNVFVPSGFDSNDNSQVVVAGYLPNTCFKVGPAAMKIDKQSKTVSIKSQAYYYPGDWCLFMVVPYAVTVDLGPIQAGGYQVQTEVKNGELKDMAKFSVSQAKSNQPDEYLYAPVREVRVDEKPGDPARVVLKGTFPNDCMSIQTVKVIQKTPQVIELLPIVDLRNDDNCQAKEVPYEWSMVVRPEWKGKNLIHVRSLNGQALNTVVDL